MYKVILRRFKPNTSNIDKEYILATENTYNQALIIAQRYSKLYQSKGLYSIKDFYPSHIVTVIND